MQPRSVHSRFVSFAFLFACTCLNGAGIAVESLQATESMAQNSPVPPITPRSNPNEDRFLQPLPTPLPTPPPQQEPPVIPTPTPTPSPEVPAVKVPVRKIEVTGSTIFGQGEINRITSPFEGREATLEELRSVADAITQLYIERGYITSRAVLPDQTVADGIVRIQIIEGRLERIDVQGTRRLNPAYVRSRIRLGAGTPLNSARLEDQLRLLRTNPLFENIEASLRSGSQIGQSILNIRITEAESFRPTFSIDNFSPPSVGSERLGVSFIYRNVTGLGDEVLASYTRSTTGGSNVLDFIYRIPLNAREGTLQLRAAPNFFKVTDPEFDELDINGDAQLYEISFRQPLIRSPRQEFALSFGFTYRDGQTYIGNEPFGFGLGPEENGVTRTSVFKFEQDYIRRDTSGATVVRSQFSLGTGLLDATINADPIPDGRFISWLGQVQRVQRLNKDHLLIIQGDVQLTPNGLLSSQQFVIGGGQSLRGYRQNIRAADNGFRFSIEDRFTVQRDEAGAATLQLAPFIDLGAVWNASENPNSLSDRTFLAGVGLGLLWQPLPKVNVRVDYGYPLINLSDRGENIQDSALYFQILYQP